MKFKRRSKRIAGKIDLIPLLDVTLLFFLFFIPSSQFFFQSVVGVDLPEAVAPGGEAEVNHTITLTKSNLIFFDGRKVNNEGLSFGLELALSAGKDPLIVIKADREVSYGRVMEIMNLVREVGIKRLALAVEPQAE